MIVIVKLCSFQWPFIGCTIMYYTHTTNKKSIILQYRNRTLNKLACPAFAITQSIKFNLKLQVLSESELQYEYMICQSCIYFIYFTSLFFLSIWALCRSADLSSWILLNTQTSSVNCLNQAYIQNKCILSFTDIVRSPISNLSNNITSKGSII